VDYLNEDAETLEVYVDLGPPLDRVKPTLLAYIDRRIDAVPEEDPGLPECTPDRVSQVANHYLEVFSNLAAGEVPTALPSLKAISRPCRILIFDLAFDGAGGISSLGPAAAKGMRANR
jgi:hypothetical protein